MFILKNQRLFVQRPGLRFLVIGSSSDDALKNLSPFAIQKGFDVLAGEPESVKKLRNGSLLIECASERHSEISS